MVLWGARLSGGVRWVVGEPQSRKTKGREETLPGILELSLPTEALGRGGRVSRKGLEIETLHPWTCDSAHSAAAPKSHGIVTPQNKQSRKKLRV